MNRENKNYSKNNLSSLKINKKVVSDKATIEAAVVDYFGALFNGHHDKNGKALVILFSLIILVCLIFWQMLVV